MLNSIIVHILDMVNKSIDIVPYLSLRPKSRQSYVSDVTIYSPLGNHFDKIKKSIFRNIYR